MCSLGDSGVRKLSKCTTEERNALSEDNERNQEA